MNNRQSKNFKKRRRGSSRRITENKSKVSSRQPTASQNRYQESLDRAPGDHWKKRNELQIENLSGCRTEVITTLENSNSKLNRGYPAAIDCSMEHENSSTKRQRLNPLKRTTEIKHTQKRLEPRQRLQEGFEQVHAQHKHPQESHDNLRSNKTFIRPIDTPKSSINSLDGERREISVSGYGELGSGVSEKFFLRKMTGERVITTDNTGMLDDLSSLPETTSVSHAGGEGHGRRIMMRQDYTTEDFVSAAPEEGGGLLSRQISAIDKSSMISCGKRRLFDRMNSKNKNFEFVVEKVKKIEFFSFFLRKLSSIDWSSLLLRIKQNLVIICPELKFFTRRVHEIPLLLKIPIPKRTIPTHLRRQRHPPSPSLLLQPRRKIPPNRLQLRHPQCI